MGLVTFLSPPVGTLHGPLYLFLALAVTDALVQAHDNVGSQPLLVGRGQVRGEPVFTPIQMRAKAQPFLVYPPQGPHAESLKAAAIGQDGSGPAHKLVQAAETAHRLYSRLKIEVVSIAQHDLGAQTGNL